MFSVVKFINSDEVKIVSTNWLCDTEDGKFCFWPKHLNSQHLEKVLLEARKPELSWIPIKVSILGMYDNYQKAEQKLRLAETPFNVEKQNEQQPTKRQRSHQKEQHCSADPQTNQRTPENSSSLHLLPQTDCRSIKQEPQTDCRSIKQEPQDPEQQSDNVCNSSSTNTATKIFCVVLSGRPSATTAKIALNHGTEIQVQLANKQCSNQMQLHNLSKPSNKGNNQRSSLSTRNLVSLPKILYCSTVQQMLPDSGPSVHKCDSSRAVNQVGEHIDIQPPKEGGPSHQIVMQKTSEGSHLACFPNASRRSRPPATERTKTARIALNHETEIHSKRTSDGSHLACFPNASSNKTSIGKITNVVSLSTKPTEEIIVLDEPEEQNTKEQLMEEIKLNILSVLPKTSAEMLAQILEVLENLGVEEQSHLSLLEEKDLTPPLKVIPARALIKSWQNTKISFASKNPGTKSSHLAPTPSSSSVHSWATTKEKEISQKISFASRNPGARSSHLAPTPGSSSVRSGATTKEKEISQKLSFASKNPCAPSFHLSPTPSSSSVHSGKTTTEKEMAHNIDEWAYRFSIPYNKLPENVMEDIAENRRPLPAERKDFIRAVCEKIKSVTEKPRRNDLAVIAKRIVKDYPASFSDMPCSEAASEGYNSILSQLHEMLQELNRENRVRKLNKDNTELLAASGRPSTAPSSLPSTTSCSFADSEGNIETGNAVVGPDWAHKFPIPYNKLPTIIMNDLIEEKRPLVPERRLFVRFICQEIYENNPKVGKKELAVIAKRIVKDYPASFAKTDCDDGGEHLLLKWMEERWCNLKRWRKKQETDKQGLVELEIPFLASSSLDSTTSTDSEKTIREDEIMQITDESSTPDSLLMHSEENTQELIELEIPFLASASLDPTVSTDSEETTREDEIMQITDESSTPELSIASENSGTGSSHPLTPSCSLIDSEENIGNGNPLNTVVDPDWPYKFSVPYHLLPDSIMKYLKEKKRPTISLRREFVRIICREIQLVALKPGLEALTVIVKRIVTDYPASFSDILCGEVVGEGYLSLLKQMNSRIENLNARRHKLKSILKTENQAFRSIDSYGCINWQPSKPPGQETERTLDIKKKEMKEMVKSGVRNLNPDDVKRLLTVTYYSLRKNINSKKPIAFLKEEWPLLFLKDNFFHHFEMLVGVDIKKKLVEGITAKRFKIWKFLTRGDTEKRPFYSFDLEAQTRLLISRLMSYFNEKAEELFIQADCTYVTEIKNALDLPNSPCLVCLGADLNKSKSFILMIGGHLTLDGETDFIQSLGLLFASFFIFNIPYPKSVWATLEFIQRCFLGINPLTGAKVEKARSHKRGGSVNTKLIHLMNKMFASGI